MEERKRSSWLDWFAVAKRFIVEMALLAGTAIGAYYYVLSLLKNPK